MKTIYGTFEFFAFEDAAGNECTIECVNGGLIVGSSKTRRDECVCISQEQAAELAAVLQRFAVTGRLSVGVEYIVVNGETIPFREATINAFTVADLAFGETRDRTPIYSITYKNGPPSNREGILTAAKPVDVADGMIFNIARTNSA